MSKPIAVVSVIASGWSLTGVDLARIPGFKIGVNDSAWRAPVDLGVTMDRLFFEGRHRELCKAFGRDLPPTLYFRTGVDKAGLALPRWISFANDHESVEMSTQQSPPRLNGLNSGICAINLAFQIRPARVILWGFDMCRSPDGRAYYHAPYPWAPGGATKPGKYLEWAPAFGQIAQQFKAAGVELINASPNSAINTIRKVDPKGLLS